MPSGVYGIKRSLIDELVAFGHVATLYDGTTELNGTKGIQLSN